MKEPNEEVSESILRNYLIQELILSEDLFSNELINKVNENCIDIIIDVYNQLYNKEIDVNKYYNMTINYKDYGDDIKVVCDNIISSLWFIGIFPPDNLDKIILLNKFEFNKKLYTFNKKSKKLIVTNI